MKKAIIIILAVILCVVLAACGAKQDAKGDSVTPQTQADTTKEETTEKKDDAKPVSIGDKITLSFAELTVDESGIKSDIKTSIKNGSITYTTGPSPISGSKFAYIRGTIKSTAKEDISDVNITGTVEIDGYKYELESINFIEQNGSSAHSLSPLTTYKYTLYAKVPDELADSHKSCVMNMGFNENFARSFAEDFSENTYKYTITME